LFCLSGVLIIVSPEARGGPKWSLGQLLRPVRHIIWDWLLRPSPIGTPPAQA